MSNKNDRNIRDLLSRECVISAIVRLPQDAFAMSQGAKCTSVLFAVKKDPNDVEHPSQGDLFLARAEYIGFTPSGKPIPENDLIAIREHFRRFEEDDWNGIEMQPINDDRMAFVREEPSRGDILWLEPEVNRTSLLYDRLSYIVREANMSGRYSYTYFHPSYYRTMNRLDDLTVRVEKLKDLCEEGFPVRGKKPSEESVSGIPILKVRNVTGRGISLESEYAPDTDAVRQECARAIVRHDDLLITSTGEGTIGRIDLYAYDDSAIADGHVTICRLRNGIDPTYVLEYLRGEYGQIQMLRHVSGSTGQTELLIDHIRNLLIPVPDETAQQAFVKQMEDARARADEMEYKASELRYAGSRLIAEARSRAVDAYLNL